MTSLMTLTLSAELRLSHCGNNGAVTAYLADILDRIHDHKINRLNELLPWNWAPATAEKSQAA